jgi:hypothetical protein
MVAVCALQGVFDWSSYGFSINTPLLYGMSNTGRSRSARNIK